jgi:hypothetical protein
MSANTNILLIVFHTSRFLSAIPHGIAPVQATRERQNQVQNKNHNDDPENTHSYSLGRVESPATANYSVAGPTDGQLELARASASL